MQQIAIPPITLGRQFRQKIGHDMNQNNIPLAAGGLSAPLWLNVVNEWLGLVAVILTIAMLIRNLWLSRKRK